jgi:hypothetical protein
MRNASSMIVAALVAMCGMPALAQVSSDDAGSRAAPSPNRTGSSQNAPSMPQAPAMAGGASSGTPATQRQCENLLTRAATVPVLRQGADYESCRNRFPNFTTDAAAGGSGADAAPKN